MGQPFVPLATFKVFPRGVGPTMADVEAAEGTFVGLWGIFPFIQ